MDLADSHPENGSIVISPLEDREAFLLLHNQAQLASAYGLFHSWSFISI